MSTSVAPRSATGPAPWRVVFSWIAVALTPVALVVGFVLGYALGLDPTIEDPLSGWDAAWRVVILWLVVAGASIVGLALGTSARRRHEPGATAAVVVNGLVFALLTLVTLVAGLVDAFG